VEDANIDVVDVQIPLDSSPRQQLRIFNVMFDNLHAPFLQTKFLTCFTQVSENHLPRLQAGS
jgi:hypothetical protein